MLIACAGSVAVEENTRMDNYLIMGCMWRHIGLFGFDARGN
jgi:hypothetical protein